MQIQYPDQSLNSVQVHSTLVTAQVKLYWGACNIKQVNTTVTEAKRLVLSWWTAWWPLTEIKVAIYLVGISSSIFVFVFVTTIVITTWVSYFHKPAYLSPDLRIYLATTLPMYRHTKSTNVPYHLMTSHIYLHNHRWYVYRLTKPTTHLSSYLNTYLHICIYIKLSACPSDCRSVWSVRLSVYHNLHKQSE